MPSTDYLRARRAQRGQTILLVAISMVSLLAMAALAIDVVTLYVARTEVQRAADAAALAGAKALADSGVTTLTPTDPNLNPAAITLAESMATSAINAVVSAPINHVAGSPPTEVGNPTFNLTTSNNNNPTVTVVLQQANLPTFFARIWGQSASTTSASATAEAYNPSNSTGGSFTPIAPRCVKPWLVANRDPTNGGAHFIDPVTGAVVANLATLTATPFDLQADCNPANPGCSPPSNASLQVQTNPATPPILVQYLPMLVTPSTADTCPASGSGCAADLTVDYEEGVACCNAKTYSCGGTQPNADWDSTISPENGRATSAAALATECLIHASTTGAAAGQDLLDYPSPWPTGPPQITAGTANPMTGQNVTTSSSIVTIPIIDRTGFGSTTGPVTVLGFLQAFVNEVQDQNLHVGEINITVMNVVGCGSNPSGTPVVGGNGASVIPVRLITPLTPP
jgi:hypothetical protein